MDNESFSLYSLFEYIKENLAGLLLLLLAFFIVIFVDNISRYNAIIFAMPSPIPVLTPPQPLPIIKPNKIRKIKKR